MLTYNQRAQTALLKAINRVFDLDRDAESLEGLSNGITLGHILHELDSEFDPSHLESNPGATKTLANKRNRQAIYKGLFRFIRRQIPELSCQAKKFDYHAFVENPEPQGISQLLAVMVSAAAMGPDNQKYVPRIQNGLDRDTQAEIMQIIRAMQQDIANSKDDDELDEAIDAAMGARDIELLVEEQNAALRQQLDITKKTLSDYITRLEHLQQSHEELAYDKEKTDRELEVLRKATQDEAHSAKTIKHLEEQVHEQMEIIARNEEVIRSSQKSVSQLESEVQRLSQKNMQADEFRDQMAEWKHKAEELEKKANMAERYKQKLESQQSLVREVQNLQYERAELQEQLRSLMEERDKSDRTKKAEDELTKMITQSEQHLWDERNQKAQLLKDVTALQEELMRLQAQRTHDEHFIQDLQEQLQHNGGSTVQEVDISETSTPFNLEDELLIASKEDTQTNMPLELSRLRAENELIRKTVGSHGDASMLRRELEELKRQRERLQQNFNAIFEKYTITNDHMQALMSDNADEGTEAFIKLRQELTRLELEFEQARKLTNSLETQLADKTRELLAAQADLSAVQKDSITALYELKSTDKLISTSLTKELEQLREETSFITNERDALKSQLIEALLANDKLRKDSDESKDLQDAAGSSTDGDGSEAAKKAAEKVEKLRERLIQRNQQLEKSEQERLELQARLKAAQLGEISAAQKAASDHIIKNLQRENALIATAWYDLTSRLQSNHVVLQRRHDAPKSWLNKQRQLVNGQLRQRDMLYLY
ncbi:HOOK protein domain-containing protein [Trichoderma breve]|uniref:HOOK protein domain-containing protein n=1 Tax=Trichoderma breve TaxID=2034170 RepID=A0A9W9E9M9_9HYPO|nr:HOOK protein domain-containing protein [Trichoderma breve]KAJ4860121.1 HOOK protein domain-containing protein [Trichoderma breve]